MAVFNRVYCSNCKRPHNIYSDRIRVINCHKCGQPVKIKEREGNYFIEFYVNSKRRREKIGSSRSLAETVLQKRKVELAENKYLDVKKEDKIKFEVFADEYLELHCKVNNVKSWQTADRHNIKNLKGFFAGYTLDEITPHKVQQYKAQRSQEVSPATVNRQLTCLKSIFNKALNWGKFSGQNPVKGIKLFKENNQRLRFLEKEEISKLIINCNEHIKPIVILALNTGMRKGEIMGLKWRDVDFNRNIVYLYNTKNGEKREIPLNEETKNTLIAVRKHPESELIFVKKNGDSYGDFKKSFFTACEKAGINNFRFHDLRHTFASHLVMSGVDLNTVRELLGHKSLAMTLRYSHLSPSHKKHAVDVLARRLDTIWTPKDKREGSEAIEKVISSLSINELRNNAGVAQLVEQLICNQPVGGSRPLASF